MKTKDDRTKQKVTGLSTFVSLPGMIQWCLWLGRKRVTMALRWIWGYSGSLAKACLSVYQEWSNDAFDWKIFTLIHGILVYILIKIFIVYFSPEGVRVKVLKISEQPSYQNCSWYLDFDFWGGGGDTTSWTLFGFGNILHIENPLSLKEVFINSGLKMGCKYFTQKRKPGLLSYWYLFLVCLQLKIRTFGL